jgi:hypothetical protein
MHAILPQAIRIQLMPSYLLLGLLSSVSIASCCILLALPLALAIKLAVIALIIISSGYYVARDALLMLPWSWQVLDINAKGELTITNMRGQVFQPKLSPSSFIHAKLVILNFQREGFKLALPSLILFENQQLADNGEDELRRLRVYLRWFKQDKATQD